MNKIKFLVFADLHHYPGIFYTNAEEKLEKWIVEKQKTTYVRINENWEKCDFKYPGWVRK